MWELLLTRYALDPWWVGGSAAILFVIVVFFVFSLFKNARSLIWFYGASILVAVLYSAYIYWYPFFVEALVAYRSDWSLVFMLNNFSLTSILSQLVYYMILYGIIAITIIVVLGVWSLLTFRWRRLRIILERSFSESWFILFFSILSVAFGYIALPFFEQLSFSTLSSMFELFAFLFVLQFFLRMIDNAYLHTPKLFMEFSYATGLVFLLSHYLLDWYAFTTSEQAFAKTMFLDHLFSFFLVILILGLLVTFFVRAIFSSAFFLEHYQAKTSLLFVWTSRLFLTRRERAYAGTKVLMGIFLSLTVGFILLLMVLKVWLLALIPAFFLGYFVLFYLLDKQDDMRVKGDLVDERIESAVRGVFFS